MKKTLIMAVAAMLLLAACGTAASVDRAELLPTEAAPLAATTMGGVNGFSPAEKTTYTVAISIDDAGPFQSDWLAAVKADLEAQGHEVISTNAGGQMDDQIFDVEALLQHEPDVIIIHSFDVAPLAAYRLCNAAGVPVVDFGTGNLEAEALHLTITPAGIGELQAEYLKGLLAANPGLELQAAYLDTVNGGPLHASYTALAAAMEQENGFALLADVNCEGSALKAVEATENLLQMYPELNVIVALNDAMAVAAVDTVAKTDRQVYILGVGATPDALALIDAGQMAGSIRYPTGEMARVAGEAALRLAGGEAATGTEVVDTGLLEMVA